MNKSLKTNYLNKLITDNKIYVYSNDNSKLKELKKNNLNFIQIKSSDDNDFKSIKILIMFDYSSKIYKLAEKNNCIIFINKKYDITSYNYILFNSIEWLLKSLNLLLNTEIKTFSILVPIYNSSKHLDRCIKSIYSQTYSNYKIFLCNDLLNDEEYEKIKKYEKLPNLYILRNQVNSGKFITLNNCLKDINSDYFLILDTEHILNKNRLLLDLIYFNEYKNSIGVQSKYINKKNLNETIEKPQFSDSSISYKTKIISKIGYFCSNRFGSDTEYVLRTKKFFGNKSILQYDMVTYKVYTTDDNTNFITYSENTKKNFLNKVTKILSLNIKMDDFCDIDLNYFDKLNEKKYINTFDSKLYIKFYKDLKNINLEKINEHWETIGKNEGRLNNMYTFEKSFPNFDYRSYIRNNISGIQFSNKYEVYGWVYLKNKINYTNWLYDNKQILKISNTVNLNSINFINSKNINKSVNLEIYITNNKIKFIYVSKKLEHFEKIIIDKFRLIKYNELSDKFENVLFFGLYEISDYNIITKHYGNKFLMWGGMDLNLKNEYNNKLIESIKEYYNIINLSTSPYISKSLDNYNIKYDVVNLNIVDKKIFKPIELSKLGYDIFIYNGISKENEEIYGKNVYTQIMNLLPEFNYILSNEIDVEYEQLPNIYSKCFIGLKLTDNDDNNNIIVQEFNSMKIPIIFNGSGGIVWKDLDNIINIIKKYQSKSVKITDTKNINKLDTSEINNIEKNINDKIKNLNNNESRNEEKNIIKKINTYDEVKSLDFSQEINLEDLENINKNIDNFINLFDEYEKILFICGDYPGYGGASTNCDKLQEFFISRSFKTYAIYFNYQYQDEKDKKILSNNKYKIICQSNLITELEIQKKNFCPEIIILKSNVSINLKKIFDCPIINLIPGLFTNELDKNYTELTDEEYNNFKYINNFTLKQIKNSDINFTNSSHTKKILLEKYSVNTFLFYSSFVPFYKKEVIIDKKFINRKYDFGVIISNFDRVIKNVPMIINFLKSKLNVVLIGKNNDKYKLDNFDSINSDVITDVTKYYRQIKYIVNFSYFESCSNVMVESIFNGCVYINKKKIQNDLIMSLSDYNNIYELIQFNDKAKSPYILLDKDLSNNKKNIIFIGIYKGQRHLKTLLHVANLINNEFTNVIILLFIGTDYYRENQINLNNIIDGQKYFYTTYLDSQNNFDKENVKKIIGNINNKIYLFDNKLPNILSDLIEYEKMQLCFLDNTVIGSDEKTMYAELENYIVKEIINKNFKMCLNYRLEQFINLDYIEKNSYLKNNVENKLYDSVLTFTI